MIRKYQINKIINTNNFDQYIEQKIINLTVTGMATEPGAVVHQHSTTGKVKENHEKEMFQLYENSF